MAFNMKGSPHKLGSIEGSSAFKQNTMKELEVQLKNLRTKLTNVKNEEEKSAIQQDINSTIKEMKGLDSGFAGIMP